MMTIAGVINNVIYQIKTQTPEYKSANPCLYIEVPPPYKPLIAFLLNLASRQSGQHFGEVKTGIRSSSLNYELEGAADEIKIVFDCKWFEHGKTLTDYFTQFIPAIQEIFQRVSEGWVKVGEITKEGDISYINPNIAGEYYLFLLRHIALNTDINSSVVGFFSGRKASEFGAGGYNKGWDLFDFVLLKGNYILIEKFLDRISHEYSQLCQLTQIGACKQKKNHQFKYSLRNHELLWRT